MKKLYLVGAGGHCKSCIDVIEQAGEYEILGLFDIPERIGEKVLGYTIIDSDENINKYAKDDIFFLVTLGQIKSPALRKKIFDLNLNLATIISPMAYVSPHAKIGLGTIVMHHALINAGSVVGANCIINSKALIEHDSIIGDHCHISTGAIVNGDCVIGEQTFIGSNTVVKNGKILAVKSLVGFGEKI